MKRLVISLYALLCLGAVLSLASCGNNGNGTGPEPSPWEDCVVGQILAAGTDPCTYPNRNEVLSINESGEACFDDDCDATFSWKRYFETSNGKTVLELELTALDDGRYAITKLGNETRTVQEVREMLQEAGELSEPVVCSVGLRLGPGESCRHDDGTSFFTFEVRSDGFGCVGGICAGTSLNLNDFSATKSGDTWTIVSLP